MNILLNDVTDMRTDMCIDMCVDTCAGISMQTCTDMCVHIHIDICGHVYRGAHRSLEELNLGLEGALNISDAMEALSSSLSMNRVPPGWAKVRLIVIHRSIPRS